MHRKLTSENYSLGKDSHLRDVLVHTWHQKDGQGLIVMKDTKAMQPTIKCERQKPAIKEKKEYLVSAKEENQDITRVPNLIT